MEEASSGQACNYGAGGPAECVKLTSGYDSASRRVTLAALTTTGTANHYGGTTSQSWKYDGIGRILETVDNNSPTTTADDGIVRRPYD